MQPIESLLDEIGRVQGGMAIDESLLNIVSKRMAAFVPRDIK